MKNKIFIAMCFSMLGMAGAYAACSETTTTKSYSSCKNQYYKSGTNCVSCPTMQARKKASSVMVVPGLFGDTAGRSADRNTNGITACYMPKCNESGSSLLNNGNNGGISTLAIGDGIIINPIDPTLPSGDCYEFQDDSGIFVFTEDCYYQS